MKSIPLFCLALLLASNPAVAREAAVREEVESLLAEDLSEDATREKVIEKLAALGAEGSWILAEKLESKDLFKYMTLREAFLKLDATSSPALRAYVEKPPEHRARGALAILAQIGSPNDLGFFFRLLDDSRWAFRAQAARGIGRTEVISPTAEERLLPFLEDADPIVRRYAAGSLGKTGTPACGEALVGRLSDESFFVRRAAKRAVAALWKRSATDEVELGPVLARVGNETDWPTRMLAIELLGERSELRASGQLKNLCEHPDWAVRAAAVRALLPKQRDWLESSRLFEEESDPLVRGLLD